MSIEVNIFSSRRFVKSKIFKPTIVHEESEQLMLSSLGVAIGRR